MATHSSILAWRNPWTGACRGYSPCRSQRVGYDWSGFTHTHRAYEQYCLSYGGTTQWLTAFKGYSSFTAITGYTACATHCIPEACFRHNRFYLLIPPHHIARPSVPLPSSNHQSVFYIHSFSWSSSCQLQILIFYLHEKWYLSKAPLILEDVVLSVLLVISFNVQKNSLVEVLFFYPPLHNKSKVKTG